ncbi:MAG: hypothetical protein HY216_17635 [Candidatus Rokubacteria bacterium]|nr:hypothetical protein [Candidatus Rokubacteria bacterium]
MTSRVLALAALIALAGCATTAPPDPTTGATITGRVTHVETKDGYVIVQLPSGVTTVVMLDKRAADTYHVGDPITLDSALRPLGRG